MTITAPADLRHALESTVVRLQQEARQAAQGAELTTSFGAVGVPLVVEDAAETASRNGVSID